MLLVDAGNLLHERMQMPDGDRKKETERGEMFVEVFNTLGYDAQGLGPKDLVAGLPRLKDLAKKAKYPFLSANLVDAKTGAPVFRDHVIVDKAGVKVGLFSVMQPSFPESDKLLDGNGVKVEDPFEVAKKQVAALRSEGAQVVVALAMLGMPDCEKLVKDVPGITAILGTADAMMLRYPRSIGNTYVTDAFQKGKNLSILTLFVKDGDKSFVFEDPNRRASIEQKLTELDARINARQAAIDEAQKNPDRSRNLEWLQQNLAKLRADRQQTQMELDDVGKVDASKSFIAFDYPSLAKDIEDDKKILAKVDALKEKYPELKEPHH